jgi:hypothetical protein
VGGVKPPRLPAPRGLPGGDLENHSSPSTHPRVKGHAAKQHPLKCEVGFGGSSWRKGKSLPAAAAPYFGVKSKVMSTASLLLREVLWRAALRDIPFEVFDIPLAVAFVTGGYRAG